MAPIAHIQRTRFLLLLSAAATTALGGCQEPEQIRTYTVPKEEKPAVVAAQPAAPTAPAAKPGEPTDRMLTAILPAGGEAWFFKVVGPIPAIDKHEKEINDFFTTVGVTTDGKPKWQLPKDWKEGPAKPMRFATVLIPTDAKPLEIAVSSASWPGTPESVLANINRWRGQLQLPPTDAAHVNENTREAKTGDQTIMIVDLRGRSSGAGMMPPFAGGAAPFAGGAQNSPSGLPPGHPPLDANSPAPPTSPNESRPATETADIPKFTAPNDWKPLKVEAGGMRKAAFEVGDAAHNALVTVISFQTTEGPQIGDPLQNVNMWRQNVGLPTIKQDELSKSTESIEIDGKPATYARAVPDPSEASQSKATLATLAAMTKTGNELWFIKLHGDRTIVTAQEDAFKSFLKSLRFAADGGATDGNK
jgi:hypothetical protein